MSNVLSGSVRVIFETDQTALQEFEVGLYRLLSVVGKRQHGAIFLVHERRVPLPRILEATERKFV